MEGWSQWTAWLFIGVVLLSGPFLVRHVMMGEVADSARRETGLLLNGTVDAANAAMTIWVHAQERQAAQLVENQELRLEVEAWLDASVDSDPALSRRKFVGAIAPLLDRSGFEGFALVDLNGLVRVASDAPLNSVHPVVSTRSWRHMKSGRLAVTEPLPSPHLVSRSGVRLANQPMVYAGAPIVDARGEVRGCLVFQVDPAIELFSLLEDLRVLSSGELYLVSSGHDMVSPSRFVKEDGSRGIWRPVHVPAAEGEVSSPTLLASAAAAGGIGRELVPYPDYRGVLVVGAWLWNEKLGVGIASELDAKEAYAGVDSAGRMSGLVAFGADVLLLLLGGIGWFGRRREQRLQKRNQAIVDLAPVPIVLTTGRGVLIGANQAFSAMVRATDDRSTLTGQTLSNLVGIDGVTQGLVPPVGTVDSDSPVRAKVTLGTPKGLRTYRVVHQRLDADQTGQRAVCTVAVDITKQAEAARKLRHFNQELEERVALRTAEVESATAVRTRFMAVMTHELRTPLHGVLGLLDLAIDCSDPGRSLVLVRRALEAGKRLRRIVNEVLDFSELDRGELELAHQQLVLSEVLGVLPDLMYGSTVATPPQLLVHVHPDVPEHFVGDGHRLQQVLSNLVGNAVKFTKRGHIKVQAALRDPSASVISGRRTWLRISVSDTGPGFEPEVAERLFDAFAQADETVRADFGGSGLGLAICRGFVERMGGRIWAEGRVGEGATFTIDLPIEVAAQQPVRRSGCALLVCEDPHSRIMEGALLRSLGLKVIDVHNLQAACACLVSMDEVDGPLHAVCLSGKLLNRYGSAGLQRLRQALHAQGVGGARVVVVEESLMRDGRASSLSQEADAVVFTPVLRDGLSSAIWPPTESSSFDHDPLVRQQWPGRRVLVVDDDSTNRFIMEAMLRVYGVEVELAEDGEAGVTAVARRDFDLVLMDLHMPRLDGRAAGRRIRALGDSCPELILVSAETAQGDVDSVFDGRLPKPVSRDELEILLHSLWPSALAPVAPPASSSGPENASVPEMDRAAALKRIGGDALLLQWLLDRFVIRHQSTVDELRELLMHGDVAGAQSILHRVCGVAGNLGMVVVAETAARAEATLSAGLVDEAEEMFGLLEDSLARVRRSLAAA